MCIWFWPCRALWLLWNLATAIGSSRAYISPPRPLYASFLPTCQDVPRAQASRVSRLRANHAVSNLASTECTPPSTDANIPAKAILVCGGVGERMSASLSKLLDSSNAEATLPSDCPPCKQFVFLNGAPVFVYSLSEFLRSPLISEITIATKPEWNLKVLELVDACTGALLQRETPDPERSKCKTTALEVNIESAAQLRPPESQDASLYRAAVHDALRAEYERHLTKFPYFFYDLVERRCVLGDAASWKDATKTAKGDSQQRYKMISLCTSGKSRASTVYNALLRKNALGVRLPGCCRAEYIALVHDAVRPLLRCLDLGGLINAARIFGAAVPAVSVADTIKVATTDSGCTLVANTPSRSTLFAVQTPQAFRSSLLKRAYASVMGEGDTEAPAHLTDDSSFVEQLSNARVAMVPGHRMNVKLTTWEDIAICSRYLKEAYSPTAES